MSIDDVLHILTTLSSPLTAQEAKDLFKAFCVDDSGKVDCAQFVDFVFAPPAQNKTTSAFEQLMSITADKWAEEDQNELKEKMKALSADENSAITVSLRKL